MKIEGNSFGVHSLADGWSLTRLRNALRSGDAYALNEATAPFYDRCCEPLLRYCDALLRKAKSMGASPAVDGSDLAIEAYQKTLRVLTGERADAIRDEAHLVSVLFLSARCACADAMRLPDTKHSMADPYALKKKANEPAGGDGAPEARFLNGDPSTVAAMTLLFTDGESFGRLMHRCGAGARHFRQYRSLALYEIGDRLRDDLNDAGVGGGSASGREAAARIWRRCAVELLSMPPADWDRIEEAARRAVGQAPDPGGLIPALRDAVNAMCGADLRDRAKLSVLRHEMGRLLERCGSELWERGNER